MASGSAITEIETNHDRMQHQAPMTVGNWDMVGRLCAAVSELRAKWGEQGAQIEAQRRRIQELENQVAELRNAARRAG